MVSINTNSAALNAQQSLNKASVLTTDSSSRLSSGNAIAHASDNVSGLAIGTILATNVSTLRQGLQNAGQAASLLQVADGGLSNISDILQRQKALAVQATSGTLSDTERGYLDQEFQNLTSEIDRTVAGTKFSSVNLLDGSLASQAQATTNTTVNVAGTTVTSTAIATLTGAPATGSSIVVNGVTVAFAAAADTVNSATAAGKVIVGAGSTQTAANIAQFLNNSNDARLANLYFTSAGAVVTANWGGGLQNGIIQLSGGQGASGSNITINAATIAVSGNAVDGLGLSRTFAVGTIGSAGNWLANGSTAAIGAGEAITLNNVERTGAFTGKIGGDNISNFAAQYVAANSVVFSLKVTDPISSNNVITYTSAATATTGGAALAITMTGHDQNGTAVGGSFLLNTIGNTTTGIVADQADANTLATTISNAFANVTFVQNRDIQSFVGGAMVNNSAGVSVGSLTGASANFRSDDFSNVQIGNFQVTAPAPGETDAHLSVTINGEQYVSYAGVGSKIATDTIIAFHDMNDPNRAFSIVTGNTGETGATGVGLTALDLTTQDNANAVAAALNTAFGVQNGHADLNFQVGDTAADSIGVQLGSASSNTLFAGQSLDVKTVLDANTAGAQLDKAINFVASLRATVGALESRFNYAATQLNTSITNLDNSRGVFLDTDVSAESTKYAQSQVKLQASISVLAQANQLPQNLLKLLA